MMPIDTQKTEKNAAKFVCESCDFECCKKSDWDRHIMRPKHLNHLDMIHNDINKNIKTTNSYNCECGSIYKHHSGLWRHKKTCDFTATSSQTGDKINELKQNELKQNEPSDKEIIIMLLKENLEFKHLILELIKKDNNVVTNNNTNTNCNNVNNAFNLNLFLNETCKDAINITEFVDNVKMNMTDLENFGHLGYVEGVSRIVIKNLKELDTYSRPIHCSDLKREVLYIKDNNCWTKETDDKPVLKNAIKQVANKNIKQIQNWKENNPDCVHSDSRKNDQYMKIVMNSMSGGSSEEQQNNISQIMKNVSKAVVIDKN